MVANPLNGQYPQWKYMECEICNGPKKKLKVAACAKEKKKVI